MLRCELCGNSIIKTDEDIFVCEGCGCKYSKSQALKLLGNDGGTSADDDFVIVAGVLKEYKGSSVVVNIPNGVLEIGMYVFRDMTSLEKVTLPDSVKHIQREAFSGCSSLKEIVFGNGLEIIDEDAFYKCISLQNFVFPEGLRVIRHGAFYGCVSISEFIIPDSVESIGSQKCFSGEIDYGSIFGFHQYECRKSLTVRMPGRFDVRLVKGCDFVFDLSGALLYSQEEEIRKIEEERVRNERRIKHKCLACGGDIGFLNGKCKRCGKVFGTE